MKKMKLTLDNKIYENIIYTHLFFDIDQTPNTGSISIPTNELPSTLSDNLKNTKNLIIDFVDPNNPEKSSSIKLESIGNVTLRFSHNNNSKEPSYEIEMTYNKFIPNYNPEA